MPTLLMQVLGSPYSQAKDIKNQTIDGDVKNQTIDEDPNGYFNDHKSFQTIPPSSELEVGFQPNHKAPSFPANPPVRKRRKGPISPFLYSLCK